ncbi:MAG: tetratricopeptide repeat protein, partial [Verrucomicrobiota bacterium]
MRTPLSWYAILLGSILGLPLTHSQDIEIATLPEEAEKYYRILQKSPSRDYLYDRFVDAWLKTEPLSQLPVFLESAATKEEATLSDQLIAGYFFTRRGDVETALQYFDEAIALEPEHTEALTEKAKLLARGLDFGEALASIKTALSAEEIEEKAILELGKLKGRYLIRQGNTEEAIEVWNELLTEFPDDHYLHEDTVEALANEGLLDEAIETAQSLVEKTTDAYDRLLRQFRVAELLVLNEETEEAVQLYEVALEQVGAGTWLEGELIARVSALFRRGDDLEGLGEWVATQSEAHPQRIDLLRMRASLAAEFGEDEEAVELYETLLQRSPGDRDIEDGFVDLLASLDRTEDAISQQESIRDLHPEDPSVYLRLAELHAAGEEFEAAGEAILEAFERTEKSELEYLRTAKFLEEYEQPQLSENLLVEGSQAHPESEEIPEALGDLLLQEEKTEEALELLNEIAADANVAQLIRLAQLPVRAGKVEPGLSILQSREEDFPDEFDYLEALIDLSVRAEARENLETLTLHLFSLADTTEKLDRVLKQALTTFADSERREEMLEKLAAKESPLPVEVALHALLLHRDGELDQAIMILEEQAG